MKRVLLALLLLLPAALPAAQSTDYTLDNQPGQSFRLELNSILAAAQSLNSGSTAPAAPVPYMLWADTANGVLKIRNGANDGWIAGARLGDMQAPDAAKLDGAPAASYQLVADMTTTATAGKGVLRDGNGRAKVADGVAGDDIMAYGQFTASAVLSRLLSVDGAGSGLDADTVDGQHFSSFQTPTGSVTQYAGASAPSGWLLCQGQAVSRTTYSALFAVLGTTYGAGNGSSTFNLPDLRGRTAIGAGQGSGLSNRVLGSKSGAETHQLSISEMPGHSHPGSVSDTEPDHTHGFPVADEQTTAIHLNGSNNASDGLAQSSPAGGHAHALSIASQGGGAAHNNMQPFIALNYIIKH